MGTMNSSWIIFAIISGLFVSAREIYIKRYINYSAEIVGFTTRLFGSVILIIVAYKSKIVIVDIPVFFIITFSSVIITAITTVIRLRLIKQEDISLTTPWLGTIPVFMVLWTALIFHEVPSWTSLIGILLVCIGSFAIGVTGKTMHFNKASFLMLLIAILIGFTTSMDKIAILASTAITYTLVWTLSSTVLMFGIAKKNSSKVLIIDKHLFIQAIFWVGEFVCQMLSVQYSSVLTSGTTYVKTLTMINIVITTFLGSIVFKEQDLKKRVFSSLLIFLGASIIVLFR